MMMHAPRDLVSAGALVALAALVGVASTSAMASEPQRAGHKRVLPPESAALVEQLLQLDTPLPGGASLNVTIDRDRLVLSAGPADAPVLSVVLVHASDAPAAAPRPGNGELALVVGDGPAPEALVTEVLKRLEVAEVKLPWRTVSDGRAQGSPRPETPSGEGAQGADRSAAALPYEDYRKIREWVRFGELDRARARLEALSSAASEPRQRLETALLWVMAGAPGEGRELLKGYRADDPVETALVELVRTPREGWRELLPQRLSRGEAARWGRVASALMDLQAHDLAAGLSRTIRQTVPERAQAWANEVRSLVTLGRPDEAEEVAREGLVKHPGQPELLHALAGVYRKQGLHGKAADVFEQLARADPTQPGILRLLMTSRLHDDTLDRDAYQARLRSTLKRDPGDEVAAFELGVLLHYDNEFEASDKWLAPLEPRLNREHRLHVYLAMNDFNLGRREAALKRLNAAIEALPDPDPDLFYCRAEIVRDTDRALAIADLERYLSMSARSPFGSPNKAVRVEEMVRDLRQCVADQTEVCESDWEHPRAAMQAKQLWAIAIPAGLGLVALAALAFVWRRRKRRGPADNSAG